MFLEDLISLCVILQWTHPVKGMVVPKAGISHSDAESSGKYCCFHWLSWIKGRSIFRIGWIFYNSTSHFSIQYLQWSRIKNWLWISLRILFSNAQNSPKRVMWLPVCPCRFVYCAQKPGQGKPMDMSIFSVCIELHIKQVLQQTCRVKSSY